MIAALAGSSLACAEKPISTKIAADAGTPAAVLLAPPPWTPSRLAVPDYVGAEACRPCHLEQYAEWARSPHGRAMISVAETSTAARVLGAFNGRAVRIPGGTARPIRDGGRYFIDITAAPKKGAVTERVEVARAIGSGRQHQVYLDADHAMLPIIWVTVTRSWISAAAYQHASAESESEEYWRSSDAIQLGCLGCHLSQGRMRAGNYEWTDLPINCESCHGPGRAHVETRAPYGDLHAISKEVDVAICAQCHARKNHFYLGRDADGVPEVPVSTLASAAFRADSTQRVTGYQTAGHLVSRCFIEGAMACSSCHDPHAQTARDLAGESAVGKNSNQQCTVCHRNLIPAEAATEHQKHPAAKIFCVDCHMPFTWMFDDPSLVQRVSDHSVSIPRPAESVELGLPNACTTCHTKKSAAWALAAVKRWGAPSSASVRPWVRALHASKTGDPRAAELLSAVAISTAAPEFARISALDALLEVPADPRWIAGAAHFLASRDGATRSIAYQVLIKHDAARAGFWRARALNDANALVRVEAALVETTTAGWSNAAFAQTMADLMALDPLTAEFELEELEDRLIEPDDQTAPRPPDAPRPKP